MASGSAPQTQEFVVRAPKNVNRKYGIIKFNPNSNIDFTTAGTVKIERENNLRDYKAAYDMDKEPKFGAGSEFGREEREEARRKKYGIQRRRYNVEDQPWLLRTGSGKTLKKYKGTKEGGILENTSYYIFTQNADGAFDAFPLKDWHSFNPAIKYNHLSIDEAEEEYNRRDKTLNYFNIMVKKRVKPEAEEDKDEEKADGKKKKKKGKGKDFLLTDMDEWAIMSDDNDEDSDEEDKKRQSDSDDSISGKGKKKTRRKIKKDHKTNSGDEAVEESDEEDEGREVDYMTDTDSDDEEMYEDAGRNKLDKYEQKGVEDEEGLQKIIESGDEEEEQEEKEESEDEEGSGNEKKEKGSDSSSGSSSDSDSDPDKDTSSALFMQKKQLAVEKDKKDKKDKKKVKKDKKNSKGKSGKKRRNSDSSEASNLTGSRSATPTIAAQGEKKEESHIAKRAKMETPPATSTDGLTEDMVRRYLMRKPMTTADLVKKLKNVGLSKEKLVISITEILKKLAPEKKTIDGKLHLWIKPKNQ